MKTAHKKFRIVAKHKWVLNATITESVCITDDSIRRFTATICGWKNWKIYEGEMGSGEVANFVFDKVRDIRNKLESGDETILEQL